MIGIFVLWIKNGLKNVTRHFYWFYRLSSTHLGQQTIVEFPVIREGKGKLSFGNHSFLGRRSELGVGQGAQLSFGNNAKIESKGVILVDKKCKLITGEHFKLGSHSRVFVKNDWTFGNHVTIETNCAIFAREPNAKGTFVIGDNSTIGDYTIIDVFDDVSIGTDVAIGPNCTFYSHDHIYTNKEVAAWKGGIVSKPISIEDGAWIGSNVTILPGISVGKRAVVAAGSIVTKNIEANCIYGGNPAKKIKTIE